MSSFIFVFSTEILKDSLTLLLAMLSLYFYTVFIKEKKVKYVIPLIILIIFLTITRIYSGFAILIGIIFDYLLNVKSKNKTRNIILTVIFGLIFLCNTNFKEYFDFSTTYVISYKYDIITYISLIIKGYISILFSPFFWNIENMFFQHIFLLIDSTVLLLFNFLFFISTIKIVLDKNYRTKLIMYYLPIIVYFIVLSFEFKVSFTRQKIAIYPFIVLLCFIELYNLVYERLL